MANEPEIDIERAKFFADLYRHEDQLIWTKVKFIFTFTSILMAAWAFAFEKNHYFPEFVSRILIPVIGLIASFLFFVTVYNGRAYLKSHAQEWRGIMSPDSDTSRPMAGIKCLPTSYIMQVICILLILFWLFLLSCPKALTNSSSGQQKAAPVIEG